MDSRSATAPSSGELALRVPAYHVPENRHPTMSTPPHPSAQRRPPPDELLSPATQIVSNLADYLGEERSDIGHRIADDKLELFVTVEPAQALLQQFARQTPEFITLHDAGGSSTLRLLSAVASALKTKVQHLAIRRQGQGVPLASLPFVEIPGQGTHALRVYSTDVDADTQGRRQLANALLSHSHLGVVIVGELPTHALTAALEPLREGMAKGPWPNRHLLLVPLGAPAVLASLASALPGASGVNVRVTPQVARLNDAWSYVTGAWNRQRAAGQATPAPRKVAATARAEGVHAATEPMPLAAAPSPAPPSPPRAEPASPRWTSYLAACAEIKGLVSACIFDLRSARPLAHTGARPDPEHLTAQGLALFNAMSDSARALGLGAAPPDAAVTLASHHLLLHPLPGQPGLMLHAVLDASVANLTLARMQLQRVDGSLLAPA